MLKIVLNIARLPISAFIEACRRIVKMMTGNANFPAPDPALNDIADAIDALDKANREWAGGSKAAFSQLPGLRLTVTGLMNRLKAYVQMASGTNADAALSSGMWLQQPKQKHTSIGQVLNVRARTLPLILGAIELNWAGVKFRTGYYVYCTTDLENPMNVSSWTRLDMVTKPRHQATGLVSGTKYAFIIVATGRHSTEGEPSIPVIAQAM